MWIAMLGYLLVMAAHTGEAIGGYNSVGECAANQVYYEDMVFQCLDRKGVGRVEQCLRTSTEDTWQRCVELED